MKKFKNWNRQIYLYIATFILFGVATHYVFVLVRGGENGGWFGLAVKGLSSLSLLLLIFMWLRFVKDAMYAYAKLEKCRMETYEDIMKELEDIKSSLQKSAKNK